VLRYTTYIKSGTNGTPHRFSCPFLTHQPQCGIFLFQQSRFVHRSQWSRQCSITPQYPERKIGLKKSKGHSLALQCNCNSLKFRSFRVAHDQPKVRSRSALGTLTINSSYAHDQLKLPSPSTQGTLTIISSYAHDHLKLRSRSAQGTLTINSSYAYHQIKVRSRSAQITLTISLNYAHDQLKVRSRSTQVTLTISSRYAHDYLKVRLRSAQDKSQSAQDSLAISSM